MVGVLLLLFPLLLVLGGSSSNAEAAVTIHFGSTDVWRVTVCSGKLISPRFIVWIQFMLSI